MNDLISRQAAVETINALHDMPNAWLDCAVDAVLALPSAQPERDKGEWIKKVRKSYPWHECTGHDADGNIHTISFQKEEITTTYRCSKCGFVVWDFEENYCPDCGRKMKKSENKESDSK